LHSGHGVVQSGLAGDWLPVAREASPAVVKTANFTVPAKAALGNVKCACWVVAAVIGLSESAKLHGVVGSTRRLKGSIGDGVRVKGSGGVN
jgi:hypothetical protein